MKKLCFIFVLVFLLALSVAEAADVPNFRDVAGEFAQLDEFVSGRENEHYSYVCDLDIDRQLNFAEQYVAFLVQYYPFVVTEHYTHDYTRTSAMYAEDWYLEYTGPKHVAKFPALHLEMRGRRYPCHVHVVRHQMFEEGQTNVGISVAYGLDYAGK